MKQVGVTPLLAAISGFACVAVGAFGAHAVTDPHGRDLIETGVWYNILHTMAAIASVSFRNWGAPVARFAPIFFFGGIVFFSGSLYLMGGAGMRMAPMAPPIGGVMFLLGWIVMIAAGVQLLLKREAS